MSLPISDLVESIRRLAPNLPPATLIAIENDLEAKEAEKKEEAGGAPKQKSQLVTVILDPENKLADLGDFTSLVIQIAAEQDTGETLDRLYRAVYAQRAAAKRRIKNITTVGDAADGLKRRFAKDSGIMIKTKTPVRVLRSDNTIPAA